MCFLLYHMIVGLEGDSINEQPDQFEARLAQIMVRDQEIIEPMLDNYERWLWERNPYRVVHESAVAGRGKNSEISYPLSQYNNHQSKLSPERDHLLRKWILEITREIHPGLPDMFMKNNPIDLFKLAGDMRTKRDALDNSYVLREIAGYREQTTEISIMYLKRRHSHFAGGIRMYVTRGMIWCHLMNLSLLRNCHKRPPINPASGTTHFTQSQL